MDTTFTQQLRDTLNRMLPSGDLKNRVTRAKVAAEMDSSDSSLPGRIGRALKTSEFCDDFGQFRGKHNGGIGRIR